MPKESSSITASVRFIILLLAFTVPFVISCGCKKDKKDLYIPPTGTGTSTGTGTESIDFKAWFADYNSGLGTAYLTEPYEYFGNGDASHPYATTHKFYRDVRYGPYERNVLDFWQAESAEPTPVIVFIHGGGFIAGNKSMVHDNLSVIDTILASGVSVAAINYRLTCWDAAMAVTLTKPNGSGDGLPQNGTRVDYILRDCARAIQFLRYKHSDWNIGKTRIAAYGGSAGAGASTWIGTVPDLANPNSEDPVLKESTRISAIGHLYSQPTYNWPRWPSLIQVSSAFFFSLIDDMDIKWMQMSRDDMSNTQLGTDLSAILDFYEHVSPGDAPLITFTTGEDLAEKDIPDWAQLLHHVRGHFSLYNRFIEIGVECEIDTLDLKVGPHKGDYIQFLIDKVKQ